MKMLYNIEFSKTDILIIVGDYIDRGSKSYEMLLWIEKKSKNVILIVGNHDKEFEYNVQLMKMIMKKNGLNIDVNSLEQMKVLYEVMAQLALQQDSGASFLITMELSDI
jgi:predicted MPP superfamily phosphohydrolase